MHNSWATPKWNVALVINHTCVRQINTWERFYLRKRYSRLPDSWDVRAASTPSCCTWPRPSHSLGFLCPPGTHTNLAASRISSHCSLRLHTPLTCHRSSVFAFLVNVSFSTLILSRLIVSPFILHFTGRIAHWSLSVLRRKSADRVVGCIFYDYICMLYWPSSFFIILACILYSQMQKTLANGNAVFRIIVQCCHLVFNMWHCKAERIKYCKLLWFLLNWKLTKSVWPEGSN